MAILDFIKGKKETAKPKKTEKKSAKVSAIKKEQKKEATEILNKIPAEKPANKAKKVKFSYEAIKQPHISEKAGYLSEKNQYIFEISPNYNKKEIKEDYLENPSSD